MERSTKVKQKIMYGFTRGNKWYNRNLPEGNEFTNLSRATFYTFDEASDLKDEMKTMFRAEMSTVDLSELHDELEIAAIARSKV